MENLRPVVAGLIGAVVSGLLVSWIARGPRELLEDGEIRYSSRMRVVSVFALSVGLFLAYGAVRAAPGQLLTAFPIGALALAFALWFALESFFVSARVTSEHLTHYSPWRGLRKIPWSEIIGFRSSNELGMVVLETTSYGKVRLSTSLLGVDRVTAKLSECERE